MSAAIYSRVDQPFQVFINKSRLPLLFEVDAATLDVLTHVSVIDARYDEGGYGNERYYAIFRISLAHAGFVYSFVAVDTDDASLDFFDMKNPGNLVTLVRLFGEMPPQAIVSLLNTFDFKAATLEAGVRDSSLSDMYGHLIAGLGQCHIDDLHPI
jgi:hypothetical protein